jgi:hypothetical protein
MNDSNINMSPEGVVGVTTFATKLNDVVGMARANSLWPLPLLPLVVELSLWQWHLIMTWLDLVQSE